MFWYALLWVLTFFNRIILTRKIELVAFAFISLCFVTVNVLWLFPTMPWVGLQCVIVVFSDNTHLLFYNPQADRAKENHILSNFI